MRVLLTPVGSAGDNLPFVGIGAALQRRGHDVTVATSDHFAPQVLAADLRFVSTGTAAEYREAVTNPDIFDPRRGFAAVMQLIVEYNRRLLQIITAEQERGPLIVVAHSLDFASRAIADRTAIPVVRVHLQPTVVRTCYRIPVMSGTFDYSFLPRWLKSALWALIDRWVLDPVAAPLVNGLRAGLGLAPVRRIFANQIHSPLLTLAMFPAWYAPPQPDWPSFLRQCDFPLFDSGGANAMPAGAARYFAAGPAPVVFTPGSAMRFGQDFFTAAVGACVRLGLRGLLLTPDSAQVPLPLPAGLARFDYLPLSDVLPRACAVVHHGGIGTTAAGFAAGLPQVVVPFSHDQPDNANRVQRLGVGRRVMPRDLSADTVAEALEELLGVDQVARRCSDIAARSNPGAGLARAAELIESVMPSLAGRA